MKFHPTPIQDAFLIEPEPRGDDRGFFARLFCEREFGDAGLTKGFVQVNDAYSKTKGTLRGMHYQIGTGAEVKIVRCIRGAFFDIVLDMRANSPTFGKSFGAALTQDNRLMMYVPRGVAHGLITLQDDTETFYLVNNFYSPSQERGVRWNDPRFAIQWPALPAEISAKDAAWPDFDPSWHLDPDFGSGR